MKLPKIYEASQYEADIYALWEKSGAFLPSGKGKSFSIVMPPPNANADLHIGYELTASIEDILCRYHRLKGENVLLLPGADHAGFETWVVYEKQLNQAGKSRFDFSRENLYQQVWDFVALNRENFYSQLRKMGVGCDWTRFTFTLDDKIVKQVYATFKKMWDEGLVYRGDRLVNFCTFHGTAFADIEVAYKEEQGRLWHIKYPLTDGSGNITVATTRPETMLGDTAVAVNPTDERYQKMVGKTVRLPLIGREIPIVADEFVDKQFGTGAVKVTPAHDPNDYEIGARHSLPTVVVITPEGNISREKSWPYGGLKVLEAREKIVEDLRRAGHIEKEEDYTHSVGHCYKCGTIIEPMLREQWFIDMSPLASRAIKTLESSRINFYPPTKKEQLVAYLNGLKDWNISRQIAWGIPIPAFQNVDNPDEWIYDERIDQEILTIDGKTFRRDPDVFDTWFSSSSWPYSTLGFPNQSDYKDFYPISVMETGGEILYPWVSRMIMMGLYTTNQIPFQDVYIHGYVMAEDGSKMSKSVGNVVNPAPVIDKYGSDALRMGIINGRAPAINRGYDNRKVEEGRNFCNKLWNIARYIEDVAGDQQKVEKVTLETPADHWIVQQLSIAEQTVKDNLDNYGIAEAYDCLYHFIWDELADWYIEASKTNPNKAVLNKLLEAILVLTHPFAPFLTETIWQTLSWQPDSILATRQFVKLPKYDDGSAKVFYELKVIVTEARYILSHLKLTGVTLYYRDVKFLTENAPLIKRLAKLKAVTEVRDGNGLYLVNTPYKCWLDIDQQTARDYLTELDNRKQAQQKIISNLETRLANEQYIRSAPSHIVEQSKRQLEDAKDLYRNIEEEYKRFAPTD